MSLQMKATRYGGPESIEAFEVDVPRAGPGQVTIEVRAAGVNPSDWKGITGLGRGGADPAALPKPLGLEISGVVTDVGPDVGTTGASLSLGDAVLAFPVEGGYSELLTVAADTVFALPPTLTFAQGANLLLVGTTAADMLRVVTPTTGDTVVVHGASGATGVSLLQQLRDLGCRVLGTASEQNFALLRRFGAEPVLHGVGLEQRIRENAPDGVDAALDCVGTDEAVDVSLALVADRSRIVTIANVARAEAEGFWSVEGATPESRAYRLRSRANLVGLAARGDLVVPMARTFPLREAAAALELLLRGHPGGKLALLP